MFRNEVAIVIEKLLIRLPGFSAGADETGMRLTWLPLSIGALVQCAAPAFAQDLAGYKPPLTISIVNRSTSASDAEVAAWTAAIQRQVHEHLAPVWKVDSDIRVRTAPDDGDWVCQLEDDPPAATPNVLGTHFIRDNGTPGCALYVRAIQSVAGRQVSYTLSHEILEILVDPWLSNVTFAPSSVPEGVTVYLREICDPVTAYAYEIDGVQVADFTLPEFWRSAGPANGRALDFLGATIAALAPAAHSYMLVRYITPYGDLSFTRGWQYVWGSYCTFGPC
jgi:hypothetical protein